jgi:hypothetical protein
MHAALFYLIALTKMEACGVKNLETKWHLYPFGNHFKISI